MDPIKAPQRAGIRNVNLKASTTFAAGTILGEITASPGTYGPYASGNADGTQNPIGILQYACVTDASGNITFGAGPAGTAEWSQTAKGAPMYEYGEFSTADLTGLDANAVTKLGRLSEGTTSAGILIVTGP